MKSKILSLSLALCLLLVMFPLVMGASALAPAADGKVYLTSAADLKALMGDTSLWDKDIVLQNDIDMTGETDQTPIGNATTAFTGSFIGVKKADGKTNPEIKGLNIKTTAATNRWGLIGYAAGNVTVKNITVRGEISSAGGGVAGIVGAMVGGNLVIEDCVKRLPARMPRPAAQAVFSVSRRTRASPSRTASTTALSAALSMQAVSSADLRRRRTRPASRWRSWAASTAVQSAVPALQTNTNRTTVSAVSSALRLTVAASR